MQSFCFFDTFAPIDFCYQTQHQALAVRENVPTEPSMVQSRHSIEKMSWDVHRMESQGRNEEEAGGRRRGRPASKVPAFRLCNFTVRLTSFFPKAPLGKNPPFMRRTLPRALYE